MLKILLIKARRNQRALGKWQGAEKTTGRWGKATGRRTERQCIAPCRLGLARTLHTNHTWTTYQPLLTTHHPHTNHIPTTDHILTRHQPLQLVHQRMPHAMVGFWKMKVENYYVLLFLSCCFRWVWNIVLTLADHHGSHQGRRGWNFPARNWILVDCLWRGDGSCYRSCRGIDERIPPFTTLTQTVYWEIPQVKLTHNYIRDPRGIFSISSLVRISMMPFPCFYTVECLLFVSLSAAFWEFLCLLVNVSIISPEDCWNTCSFQAAENGRTPEQNSRFYVKGALQYLIPPLLECLTRQVSNAMWQWPWLDRKRIWDVFPKRLLFFYWTQTVMPIWAGVKVQGNWSQVQKVHSPKLLKLNV